MVIGLLMSRMLVAFSVLPLFVGNGVPVLVGAVAGFVMDSKRHASPADRSKRLQADATALAGLADTVRFRAKVFGPSVDSAGS